MEMRSDTGGGTRKAHDSSAGRILGAFLIYALVAAVVTWPLLRDARTLIASDPGDPILNTAILVWNATVLPFSEAWWTAPHFFPTTGTVAFTENLLGLYPLASPIYWLSGNPVLAYNLTLFLMWPLSALAVFLLVRRLVAWEAAAGVAGLAFAFSPMRAVALPHIQTMATFGVPLCLLALHGYRQDRRRPWLVLFGLAWLHQGLANGYYILYGGLTIGLWALYFCSTRERARAMLPMVAAGALASLPLVPMLLRYRAVHDAVGIGRSREEIVYFSAGPQSWFEVGEMSWLWHRVLPAGTDNFFPGLTVIVLVAAGLWAWLARARAGAPRPGLRGRWALAAGVAVSAAAVAFVLWHGPVNTAIGPVPIKLRQLDRALLLLVLTGVPLLWTSGWFRAALAGRSPILFYVAGVGVFAVLACGPVLRVHGQTVLDPAPYGWLMRLPGFNELRVPTQIKMVYLLFLSVAGGLSLAVLRPSRPGAARAVLGVVVAGVLLDGWLMRVPMVEAQPRWPIVEPASRAEPVLELPLGPAYDAGATLRAAVHHRRVMNGVSGYDPPHYAALREGLAAQDPALLMAVATLGPLDVVVDGASDPDGSIARYVTAFPGATRVGGDGVRTVYRLSGAAAPAVALGAVLPVAHVRAVRETEGANRMHDGRPETGWTDVSPKADGWVMIDLGTVREVGGLTLSLGRAFFDFPRHLAIETSLDGETWVAAWDGPAFAQTFLGFVQSPRNAELRFRFHAEQGRYVRVRRLDAASPAWHVAELQVHAPAPGVVR